MKIYVQISNLRIARAIAGDYYDELNGWFEEMPDDLIQDIQLVSERFWGLAKLALEKRFPGATVMVEDCEIDSCITAEPEEMHDVVEEYVQVNRDEWEKAAFE